MEEEKQIKGIDRINTEVRKLLSDYFGEKDSAKLEQLLLEYIQAPNGLEVADFRTEKESVKRIGGNYKEVKEKYFKEGKSVIRFNIHPTELIDFAKQNSINSESFEIDLYVNMPVSYDDLDKMLSYYSHTGTEEYLWLSLSSVLGYAIPKAYYEEHEQEILDLEKEVSQHNYDETVVKEFAEDLFRKYLGEEVRTHWRDTTKDDRMQHAIDIISKLTNGRKIEDISLDELENIKSSLEQRRQQLVTLVAERFGTKENEQAKE